MSSLSLSLSIKVSLVPIPFPLSIRVFGLTSIDVQFAKEVNNNMIFQETNISSPKKSTLFTTSVE